MTNTAHVIDGRHWASVARAEIATAVRDLAERDVYPHLAVVLVGEHPASMSYVKGKEKAAREVGMKSDVIRVPDTITQEALLQLIGELNADADVHGILVQLPLPTSIDEAVILGAVAPEKDVDGFHIMNVGALSLGLPGTVPCTPLGVMRLLAYEGISVAGKHAVVLGRSNIVGKPMAQLLLAQNATVTVCHSRTVDLGTITRTADILVAAIGRPAFVVREMVKPGAVVIDVGINRVDGVLCGDVEYAGVSEVASAITPVPRGVGPMTIAMLLNNTLLAAKRAHAIL